MALQVTGQANKTSDPLGNVIEPVSFESNTPPIGKHTFGEEARCNHQPTIRLGHCETLQPLFSAHSAVGGRRGLGRWRRQMESTDTHRGTVVASQ
jgi:hypothetical protein